MAAKSLDITKVLHDGRHLSVGERLRIVAVLSWPAVMAQLSSIVMEYIDAAMVGSLGANASASIGLVATTTWLFWGIGSALCSGFSVQVAHQVGAGNFDNARDVLRQSILSMSALSIVMALAGVAVSGDLPHWLGGGSEICSDSSAYFMIFAITLPFYYLSFLAASMLRCAGNMVVPGMLNVLMCVLDVVFNMFMIFPTDTYHIFGLSITLPGAGLGVTGAAIGSGLSALIAGGAMVWYVLMKSDKIKLWGHRGSWRLTSAVLRRALFIALPMGAERIVMNSAQIVLTIIVAPLGAASIAANAFAITAEGLCYMPGYGLGDAATTLVGQSIGAGRKDLARGFSSVTIICGMVVMGLTGVVMWLGAPLVMEVFTPDALVRSLGVDALRIEAWAEPMFAAAIVTYGVFVGAGTTLVPACINLTSMWVVRITLAAILAPIYGLSGVWLAMCIELCVRGASFIVLYLLRRNKL